MYQNENIISFPCSRWFAFQRYEFLMHYWSELLFKMERQISGSKKKKTQRSESSSGIFQVFQRTNNIKIKAARLKSNNRNVTGNAHHSRNSINVNTNVGEI